GGCCAVEERGYRPPPPVPVQIESDEPVLEQAIQQHAAIEVGEARRRKRRRHVRGLAYVLRSDRDYRGRFREGQTSRRGERGRCASRHEPARLLTRPRR